MAAPLPPAVPWTLRAAGARLALGSVAVTTIGLLSSSLSAFPSPTLPKA